MSDKPYMDLRDPKQRSWLWGYTVGAVVSFVVLTWTLPWWGTALLLVVGVVGWSASAWGLWSTRKGKRRGDSEHRPADKKYVIIEVEVTDSTTDAMGVWFAIRDAIPDGAHVGDVSLWLDSDDYWENRRQR